MTPDLNRRDFVKASAVGLATLAAPRALGANERLRAGFIGVANRGSQLIKAAQPHSDCEIVAVCDVHTPTRDKWAAELGATAYGDFREILDRKDIDVVFVATPDHWHAVQTTMACNAGKDVYCEKPVSQTIVEGRKMVECARRNQRIVQVGLQRRSSPMYQELHEVVSAGKIGKVTAATCYRVTDMWPRGIGKRDDSAPPADLDWNMWLGPRAERPYRETIAPYRFRWWDGYSSQTGNWGVHFFDTIRWALDEEAPVSVSAHGGKFAIDDDRTIPDTMQVIFEFASGRLMFFAQYEASNTPLFPADIELRGTQGIIYAKGESFELRPEGLGQFQTDDAPRAEAMQNTAKLEGDLTSNHIRNFLDCVKSRETPNCDIEEGHRSTTFALLANIALATKSRIEWDAKAERAINNDAANALLHYEYREPWKLG